jgi:hypothetical protein
VTCWMGWKPNCTCGVTGLAALGEAVTGNGLGLAWIGLGLGLGLAWIGVGLGLGLAWMGVGLGLAWTGAGLGLATGVP